MEKDWIKEGYLNTPAPRQVGATCYVHAVVGTIQACLEKIGRFGIIPSAQDPINCCCDPGGTIEGGNIMHTLNLIKERGIAIEADYALEPDRGACRRCGEGIESRVFIDKVVEIEDITIGALEAAVNNQPVVVDFYVGPEYGAHGYKRSPRGVLRQGIYIGENPDLDIGLHSAILVGYGKEGRYPYWKFRNASGPQWGDNGCIMVHQSFTPSIVLLSLWVFVPVCRFDP